MMNENPLISIIIPVYNTASFLDRCICSASVQRYENLEILLVDDGSTDKSGDMCDDWAGKDPRIRVIHKINGGLSSARNAALDSMCGKYLFFLDSDDYIFRDTISDLYSTCADRDAEIACCGNRDASGCHNCGESESILHTREALKRMFIRDGLDSNAMCKLYLADLYRDIRFPEGALYEDVPVTYKVIMRAQRIVITGKCGYYTQMRQGSITRSPFQDRDMSFITFTKAVCDAFAGDEELSEYARTFYLHAVVCIMVKAGTRGLDKNNANEQAVRRIFAESYTDIMHSPYLVRKQKILSFLAKRGVIRPAWALYIHFRNRRLLAGEKAAGGAGFMQEGTNSRKIYIVSPNGIASAGGVERVCYYLREILMEKNEVVIISLDDVTSMPIYRRLRLPKDNSVINAVFTSQYVRKTVEKDDVIITNGFCAPFLRADCQFAHGSMYGYGKGIGRSGCDFRRVTELLEAIAGHKAKCVIAVAEHAKDEYIRQYRVNPRKIRVVNNCVNTDVFYPIEKSSEADDVVTILFCGRLDTGKNVDKLERLAQRIEKTDGFALRIAAAGKRNIDLFEGLKKTHIDIGLTISQLNDFYNSGSVFYFPSKYEGFEMVTTESLAAGVPVAGNCVGAIDELHRKKTEGVYLLASDNVDDTLKQLRDIAAAYKSHSKRMQLHESMAKEYSINIYMQKLRKVFEHLI